jgi:hypothetical protein
MLLIRIKQFILPAIIVMLIYTIPQLLIAYSGGPPDGRTGAPGEGTCADCHSGGITVDGSLQTHGIPIRYGFYADYLFYVDLEDNGQQRWGFEITAIDSNGNAAGHFEVWEESVQLSDNPEPARDYVKQTEIGTFEGTLDGPVRWRFKWFSPGLHVGKISFYLAAVAADGSHSPTGDCVYTLSVGSDTCLGKCGDCNFDGYVNISDAVFLINYVFMGGPPPQPLLACGDANEDGAAALSDAIYIINYVFVGGNPPGSCSPGSFYWEGACCPFQ